MCPPFATTTNHLLIANAKYDNQWAYFAVTCRSILLVLVHAVSPHINTQRKGLTLQLFLVLDAITLKQLL